MVPTAAHLAKLMRKCRVGGKMSKKDLQDPAKAKYISRCCGGDRVWNDSSATIYMDRLFFSLCSHALSSLPVTLMPPPVLSADRER